MKFFVTILITALVSFSIGIYTNFPWWYFSIGVFIVHIIIQQKPGMSFLSAFLGNFILWFILALLINYQNNQILAKKISILFFQKDSLVFILIFFSALVGGLTAGVAGLTGTYFRMILKSK